MPSLAFRARRVHLGVAAAACLLAAALPGSALARQRALYVSPQGSDGHNCTRRKPCRTIGHAVAKAPAGSKIIVRRGAYTESVKIDKRLRLVGVHRPVIDATGNTNGILISGHAAARSLVRGFVVERADQEGFLAMKTARVTIQNNIVRQNDLGAAAPQPTGECAPQGQVPGDCGEGVHLMSVTRSRVLDNRVTRNAGGILLTDELGPTAHNLIRRNRVYRNPYDCGITIAGHSDKAVQSGKLMPKVAGIYRNRILRNFSNANGLRGEGAGILLATAGPGTAVYSNLIRGNTANRNNLAGITLHSHAPGDYLNRNRLVANLVRSDNRGGDPDAGDSSTTGILVFSAVNELQGTVVRGNVIRDVHYGIWTQNVPTIPQNANRFQNVSVPLFQK